MRSKISFFNKTIFKKNLTRFWPIWGVYTVVCLWILPVYSYLSMKSYLGSEVMTEAERSYIRLVRAVEGIRMSMSTWCVFGFALLAAMAVFSYLHIGKNTNMLHALPVRREELFLTNYLSGLLFLLVPQVLAFLTTIFLWFANGINHLEYLLQWLGIVTGEAVFAYSLSVFCVMLTGHIAAVPACFFLLNYFGAGVHNVADIVLRNVVYGFSGNQETGFATVLSPLSYISSNVKVKAGDPANLSLPVIEGGGGMAAYAAVGIFLAAMALVMYRKRELECVGDILVISWLKPLLRWGGAALSAGIFSAFILNTFFYEQSSTGGSFWFLLLSWLAAGIILFFGIEMLMEKKFFVFGRKRLIEGGIFAGFILLFLTGMELDVMGLENKRPNADEVQGVRLSGSYEHYITGEDRIKECIRLQKDITAHKKEYESYFKKYLGKEDCPYMELTLIYEMKDGSSKRRSYALPLDDYYLEQKESPVEELLELEAEPEDYLAYYFTGEYAGIRMQNGSTLDFLDDSYNFRSQDISTETAQNLLEAFKKDVMSGNYRIYPYSMKGRKENTFVNTLTFCMTVPKGARLLQYSLKGGQEYISDGKNLEYASVVLTKECKNTISMLEELGYVNDEAKLVTEKEYETVMDNELETY